jgi:hypothetical protein
LPPNPTDALRRAQDVLSPLQGDVVPSDLLPSNPSDALRRALPNPSRRDVDLPSVDPSDALRRAQELSSPQQRDFVPTGLSTPSTDDAPALAIRSGDWEQPSQIPRSPRLSCVYRTMREVPRSLFPRPA